MSALDLARAYLEQGVAPIPVAFMGKAPTGLDGRLISKWQNLRIGVEDLARYFNGQPQNVGALLGEPSKWLVDVDLDCPEAIRLALHFLPPTRTFGRASALASHHLYYAAGATTLQLRDPTIKEKKKSMICELRSTGVQTVLPGSTHESGEPIIWTDESVRAEHVDPIALRARIQMLAAAALLTRYAPEAWESELATAIAAGLESSGWARFDAIWFAEAVGDLDVATVATSRGWARAGELLDNRGRSALAMARTWLSVSDGVGVHTGPTIFASPDNEPEELSRISPTNRYRHAKRWLAAVPKEAHGDGSSQLIRVAATLCRGFALGEAKGYELLASSSLAKGWTASQLHRRCEDAMRGPVTTGHAPLPWGCKLLGGEAQQEAVQDEVSTRATIRVGVDIARVVDESVSALRSDPEIFVRGGSLTRVIESDGSDKGVRREPGAPVMRRISPSWTRERLSMHAQFMSTRTRKGFSEDVEVQPPPWLGAHVVERGTWNGYRALTGVVTSPTIRADGSILQEHGYDAQTGLVYIPRGQYPRVAEDPMRDDVIRARDELIDVIADFPLTQLGRAGWLALLFTLIARELVDGPTPLIAVDAHSAASGKGLLARSAHIIGVGGDVAHMSLPPNEEEFRKQVTTLLLSGDPAVLIDNVSVPIGGDSLDAIVTAPIWKVRMLGCNEDSGALVPRLVWIVTGNGIQLVGDLARRTLRIHLDSPHENPEERVDYSHPERAGEDKFTAWLRAERPRLVHAALTCLRAWHVAGRKGNVRPWGSFDSWVSTIGRCVQWLGLPDPSDARATKDAALDPARRALGVIYEAIERLGGKDGLTAGELVRLAFPRVEKAQSELPSAQAEAPTETDLAEAIDALVSARSDDKSKARALGRKLKAGRIIDRRKLVQKVETARSVRYRVVSADAVVDGEAGE